MYRTLAPLICNPLKEGRKGIAFRYPPWPGTASAELARVSNATKVQRQGGAIPAPPFPAPPFWGPVSTCAASPEQTLHVSRLKPQPRARRQLLGQIP